MYITNKKNLEHIIYTKSQLEAYLGIIKIYEKFRIKGDLLGGTWEMKHISYVS